MADPLVVKRPSKHSDENESVQGRAARHRADSRRGAARCARRPLLALGRRGLERRVPRLRCTDHVVRALLRPSGAGHRDRQPLLRPARHRQPAGPDHRHHRLHGQPGAVRAERESRRSLLQLDHPGGLRDRGHRHRRARPRGDVPARRPELRHRAQGASSSPRRGRAVPDAVPRSRDDHQGAALALVRVHRRLRGDGRPDRAARAPEQPAPERLVGRLVDGPRGHHLGGRPRLERERQRLLALPAARHPQGADLLGGDARPRDPLAAARAARRGRLRHQPQDDRRHRRPRGLRRLVLLALHGPRPAAAVCHQHDRPLLLGCDPPGLGASPCDAGRRS